MTPPPGRVPVDERAVSTGVEKVLALGLVALYVSLVATTVYGGVVPDYRTAAGSELADRTLAVAAQRVQQAVPPNATAVDVRLRVRLPATIRGAPYEIRADNRTLVLEHPRPGVDARTRLGLPPAVTNVSGRWHSGEPTVVRVRTSESGLVVRLETGGA